MPELKARLLIADDDPSTRISLTRRFAERGYRVRSVSDGISALTAIHRQLPEFLISDLNLPGTPGFEFLTIIRSQFPEIRVIAMSSALSGDEICRGIAADAFFPKGGGFGVLLRIMRSLPRPERMAQQTHAAPPPVWVSRYLRNSAGEGYVTIECPECMGSFPLALQGMIDSADETNCFYCGGRIRYVVVQSDDWPSLHAFLSPLQRRHSAAEPALQSVEEAGW
jgi:CheY-like chemotaxis protein